MTHLRIVKPSTKPEKSTHSTVDTIMLTQTMVKAWKSPPFQRPLRVNEKLMAISRQIMADGGVIPGVVTLGVLDGDIYIVDGQHRAHAFELSGCTEGYVDVRTIHFQTLGDMAEEFVQVNSKIVSLRPDDILRGMETSLSILRKIRKECPFVGYDMIRRGDKSPILSMSAVLRTWAASCMDVPQSGGMSTLARAQAMTDDEAQRCAEFLNVCMSSWGREAEYGRLWGMLNLSVVGWLYRRIVIGDGVNSVKRHIRMTPSAFGKAIMSLSADDIYMSWLVGRQLTDRDRVPCYHRVKVLMTKRIENTGVTRVMLPQPAWVAGSK